MKKWIKKLIITGSILGGLMALVGFVGPAVDELGYRYLLGGFAMSYVTPVGKKVKTLKEKTGGIIHGICHPKGDYASMKDLHCEWARFDLTYPVLNAQGQETAQYQAFKAEVQGYKNEGLKVMAVTPYPQEYLYYSEFGGNENTKTVATATDPRTDEGLEFIKRDIRYLATDMQGILDGIQVTNEMPVNRFREPLTLAEAARYVGVQLEALNDVKGNIICGYNVADTIMMKYMRLVKPYHKYCDYLGLDLYLGCFEGTFTDLFWYDLILRAFYNQGGLPMIVNEFGYLGAGSPKTDAERTAYLQTFGYNSEAEARADILNLIEHPNFNETLRNRLYTEIPSKDPAALADRLFSTTDTNTYRQHFYQELSNGYELDKYRHTREDQARFYTDVINEHFKKMPFLCGAFAYMLKDSGACYICGSADCPVETGWGFINANGEKQPSYYALKEAYSSWN